MKPASSLLFAALSLFAACAVGAPIPEPATSILPREAKLCGGSTCQSIPEDCSDGEDKPGICSRSNL